MALTAQQVHQFYVGYYGRPADTAGLAYWQGQTEAAALAGFSASAEFTTQYASAVTTAAKVTQVYNNLLGRAPDAAGLTYWSGEITAGRETLGTLLLSVVKNALGKDVTTIADRVAYSTSFTAALDTLAEINAYNGTAATGLARAQMSSIVASSVTDHATLTTATNNINATTTSIVNLGVAGQTFSLTNSATPDTFALTSGNDTVTGATGTFAATDAIIDATTTDSDTLTAQVNVANLAPTITKVENVTINGDFVTTGLDLANVRGSNTITFNTNITSGTATVGTAVAGAGAKTTSASNIAFGSNVTTATINADATVGTAGTLKVNAGSVTALTLTGASAVDNYEITTNGNVAFTGSTTAETLKLIPTVAAKTITLDGANVAGNTLDVGGSVAATLKGTAANLTGKTITKSGTGSLTVEVATTGGAADLSKVAADAVTLAVAAGGATEVTVKSGTSVSTSLDQGNAGWILGSVASSAATNAVTFNNTASNQTGLVTNNIKTLTVNSAATAVSGIDATYAVLNAGTNNVVLTGSNDVKVTAGTAASVDASALVGLLNYTQAATAATTVKGGSGANVVVLANAAVDATYIGQNGGDNVTAVNTTGATSITTGSGNDVITATGIIAGTGALSATTGAGDDTISATAATTGVISAVTGAGNDTVTLGVGIAGAAVVVFDGGDGTDTLKIGPASDIKAGTLSLTSVESIELTANGTIAFSAAQMSGKTYTIKGTAGATDILSVTGVAGTSEIDLSTLTMDQTLTKAMSKTTIVATASTGAVVIKGTAVADTITVSANGSSITAGGGADTMTFAGGVDKLFYTASTASALKTESAGAYGATATTAPAHVAGTSGDLIGSFTTGTDKIVLSVALGTAGAVGGLVASAGTSYTTASTGLTAEDFLTTTLGTSGAVAANTAGGGRFIFDTVGKLVIYDISGDSVINASGAYTAGAADDFVVAVTTGVNLAASDFAFA